MSQIVKETVDVFKHGHTPVGTSAVQLTLGAGKNLSSPQGMYKGVKIKCPGSTDTIPNTVSVYVGNSGGVTADHVVASGGFPLAPGESITIPIADATKVWFISSAVSQNVAWILV